jgi:hypothetical protein
MHGSKLRWACNLMSFTNVTNSAASARDHIGAHEMSITRILELDNAREAYLAGRMSDDDITLLRRQMTVRYRQFCHSHKGGMTMRKIPTTADLQWSEVRRKMVHEWAERKAEEDGPEVARRKLAEWAAQPGRTKEELDMLNELNRMDS